MHGNKSPEDLLAERVEYSTTRLTKLVDELEKLKELNTFPNLTIFSAGSYARKEASEFSDIDLFFLDLGPKNGVDKPRTNGIRLFARVIEIADRLGYPPFSNDAEFLRILHIDDMVSNLGGRDDDYENHFTTRMLLLLESFCLYRPEKYDEAIKKIIESYFRDFPEHSDSFKPYFLLNDIERYWKTLCLNYEFKRNSSLEEDKTQSIKQRIRNFKLKFSRMTTCFATIGYLASQSECTVEQVVELVKFTPQQRLQKIKNCIPQASEIIDSLLIDYSWFLGKTALSQEKLHEYFANDNFREDAFKRANGYGDKMYELLGVVGKGNKSLRYLVI